MAANEERPLSVFRPDTSEYWRLVLLRDCLNAYIRPAEARVQETWFDRGQDWRYTTVLVYTPDAPHGMQVLSPRQQRQLLYGTIGDFTSLLVELRHKHWFHEPGAGASPDP